MSKSVLLPDWAVDAILTVIVGYGPFLIVSGIFITIARRSGHVTIGRLIPVYIMTTPVCFLVSIPVGFRYVIEPLNNYLYGLRGGLTGPVGVIEELVAFALVSIPLLSICNRVFSVVSHRRYADHGYVILMYGVNFITFRALMRYFFIGLSTY